MKRYFTLILALLLLVALPLTACKKKTDPEQEQRKPSEGLQYISTGNGTCYLAGLGVCTDTDILVPETSPAGDTVTGVGREAFKDCTTLTDIALPSGVVSIGNRAFAGCTALKTVQIPNGIAAVGMDAFDGCTALQYNGNGNAAYLGNAEKPYLVLLKAAAPSISKCTVPESTKVICSSAFNGCESLRSLALPQGLTCIGTRAFSGAGITSASIPAGVTKIEVGTFYECVHLTTVEIPAGVTEIGAGAFGWCTALTQIEIPAGVTTIEEQTFAKCVKLTSVSIPKSVTQIGSGAFADCVLLESVNYAGTQAEWEAVVKTSGWNTGAGDYTVHCTDGDITK